MNIELPTPIAAFFQAHNTGKTDDFKALSARMPSSAMRTMNFAVTP